MGNSTNLIFEADTNVSYSLSLEVFVDLGKPDYDVDGGQFSGEKTFGNLTLTGSISLQRAESLPFISIALVREKLPAFSSDLTIISETGALNLGANVSHTSEGSTTVRTSAAYF